MRSDSGARSLLELCRSKDLTIVTAESCTGGMICAGLTEIPGSSDSVWGGFVTYANDAKIKILNVSEELILKFGAVSKEVVEAMVSGALDQSGADLAVAVSGIAGPGGGTLDKPVGTVWISAGLRTGHILSQRHLFPGDREEIRESTVDYALSLCEKIILNVSSLDSEHS